MPRRGRGFNAQELANLESWRVKVREDEKLHEPAVVEVRGTIPCDPIEIGRNLEAIARGEIRVVDSVMSAKQLDASIRASKARAMRASGKWWDMKRGVWRNEEP